MLTALDTIRPIVTSETSDWIPINLSVIGVSGIVIVYGMVLQCAIIEHSHLLSTRRTAPRTLIVCSDRCPPRSKGPSPCATPP